MNFQILHLHFRTICLKPNWHSNASIPNCYIIQKASLEFALSFASRIKRFIGAPAICWPHFNHVWVLDAGCKRMVCMVKDLCGSRWFALWCAVLSVVLIVRVHCACLLQLNCRLDVHDNNREQKNIPFNWM